MPTVFEAPIVVSSANLMIVCGAAIVGVQGVEDWTEDMKSTQNKQNMQTELYAGTDKIRRAALLSVIQTADSPLQPFTINSTIPSCIKILGSCQNSTFL